ncbi:MAG TPA: 2,3-bisphosphoglycerate-dependent phosphoglycerate mutase [Streptosporangiaceae bacterium]|nr:2,3-bisphosphoglycerate-dependent phosphoglycerate mutase [Streptosporangiaceae bacterium]
MSRLIVLRHGQSECNAAGVFTGWANAHLTANGEYEATRAGAMLAEHGMLPAFVHTSLQRRTIRTAELALAAADRDWIPVRRSWRLNGRHYGALQGRSKAEVLQEYGEQQVMLWRRSYDVAPPPLSAEAGYSQAGDPRYEALPPDAWPRAESLADVSARLLPYWYDAIVPDLRAGGCVLVVSHGNTLRALVKHLDSIPADQIAELDIPTGIPMIYELGPDMRPDALGGQYLDPRAARAAVEAVRKQGRAARPAAVQIQDAVLTRHVLRRIR